MAFVTYLWHPRTQGALYIYETFVSPFLAKHEPDIDRHIDETRASVGDVVVRNSRGAVDFVRNKMTNLLMSVPQANGGGSTGEARYMGARNATEAAATAYTRVPPKPRSDVRRDTWYRTRGKGAKGNLEQISHSGSHWRLGSQKIFQIGSVERSPSHVWWYRKPSRPKLPKRRGLTQGR